MRGWQVKFNLHKKGGGGAETVLAILKGRAYTVFTATQNHSRWVPALAWTPNATILCYLYQHVGI